MTTATLSDLLVIEADPKLLGYVCPVSGVPYWQLIRTHLLRVIMSDKYYAQPIVPSSAVAAPKSLMLNTAVRSLVNNMRVGFPKAPVTVMATAVGMIQSDGRWMNRLADHFVQANPSATLLVEDQFQWNWRAPRVVSPIRYHMPLQATAVLRSRLAPRAEFREMARSLLAIAAKRAEDLLGYILDGERLSLLERRLAARASELPHLYAAYIGMLKRLGTKILLKEEACYGGGAAVMAAANHLDIVTAEYQHGLISRGHDAYNFSLDVLDLPALRHCLPRYVLTYGDWWNQQMCLPVERVTVGNPHRSYVLEGLEPEGSRRDVVLFLGDGLDTAASLKMAATLAKTISPVGLRLIFRPHPLERQQISKMAIAETIAIDQVPDISTSMAGVVAVIGETSTGLFEAAGLAKRVFVWDTPKSRFALGEHLFETFETAEELTAKLGQPSSRPSSAADELWAPNWRMNYARFLRDHGVSSGDGGS